MAVFVMMLGDLANMIEEITHAMAEPLTTINNYAISAQRLLSHGWPDMGRLHLAVDNIAQQASRNTKRLALMRAVVMLIRNSA